MSIIVAVQKDGRTVMAADTAHFFGSVKVPPSNARAVKIRRIGGSLIGIAGWAVHDNILQDHHDAFAAADLTTEVGIFRLFAELGKSFGDRYESFEVQRPDDDESPLGDLGATWLIANAAGIFLVSSDTSVLRLQRFHAVGHGGDFAQGALAALYDDGPDAAALARRAVEIAIDHSVYCAGDVVVEEVSPVPSSSGSVDRSLQEGSRA